MAREAFTDAAGLRVRHLEEGSGSAVLLLHGASLEALVDAPFGWQEGWRYTLPSGWTGDG